MRDHNERARLRDYFNRLEHLIDRSAPGCIKAHCLVRLVFPQLVRVSGVKPELVMGEITQLLAEGWCWRTGICGVCKTAPATTDDRLCVTCTNDINRMAEEAGLLEP